jgi:hypothetical protein
MPTFLPVPHVFWSNVRNNIKVTLILSYLCKKMGRFNSESLKFKQSKVPYKQPFWHFFRVATVEHAPKKNFFGIHLRMFDIFLG